MSSSGYGQRGQRTGQWNPANSSEWNIMSGNRMPQNRAAPSASANSWYQSAPTPAAPVEVGGDVQADFHGGVDASGTRYHKFRNQAEGRNSIYNDNRWGPYWIDSSGGIVRGKAPYGKTQYGAAAGTAPTPSTNPEYNQEGWVYSGRQGQMDSWIDDQGRPSPTGPGGQMVPDSLESRRAQGMFWRDAEGNPQRGVAPAGYYQWNAGLGEGTVRGSVADLPSSASYAPITPAQTAPAAPAATAPLVTPTPNPMRTQPSGYFGHGSSTPTGGLNVPAPNPMRLGQNGLFGHGAGSGPTTGSNSPGPMRLRPDGLFGHTNTRGK